MLDLISSIKEQEFPQDQIEIIVVSEGDSESAKSIGIQKAVGEICVMLCADNYFTDPTLFKKVHESFKNYGAVYEKHYAYRRDDNSLNRYFSLIGGNDPVCYFLGKNDRQPWVDELSIKRGIPSYGCNGFFVKRFWFQFADLDHYYPMDAHVDMQKHGITYLQLDQGTVWHRTSDNLLTFMKKRYKYARDLYCKRQDRRWQVISGFKDTWRLVYFILCVISVVPLVLASSRGYRKIKDPAWYWHYPVCLAFCSVYGALSVRWLLSVLSYRLLGVRTLYTTAKNHSINKLTKTLR